MTKEQQKYEVIKNQVYEAIKNKVYKEKRNHVVKAYKEQDDETIIIVGGKTYKLIEE